MLAAPASHKAQGRSASGRNGGVRKTTSSNKEVMRLFNLHRFSYEMQILASKHDKT